MATNKRISSKKNRQLMIIEIVALIAVAAGAAVGGVLLYNSTKEKNVPVESSSVEDSSSSAPVIEERSVNSQKLAENFAYAALDSRNVGTGLCYVGENESGVSRAHLQPIFNAVFDRSGLQIASVANSDIACRAEMVNPLNDMLCDFYEQTQLRTVMIDSAYLPPESEAEEDETPEPTLPEGGFYDTYGNYITFGYTDSYGNYYSDGYYDSFGNYMGYGYYDEDGSYISYEDLAASGGAEPPEESEKTDKESDEPCASGEHSDGFSVDFSLYYSKSNTNKDFDGSDEYAWFAENCWRYGFILRCPEEKKDVTGKEADPSHFRYVGRTAAKIMHDNALALEELSGALTNYSYDSPLTVNTEDGTAIVYTIESSGLETTNIQIPADESGAPLEFDASDGGDGRFIIIVLLTEDFLESADSADGQDITDTSKVLDSYTDVSSISD